jgi:hypothetical protein
VLFGVSGVSNTSVAALVTIAAIRRPSFTLSIAAAVKGGAFTHMHPIAAQASCGAAVFGQHGWPVCVALGIDTHAPSGFRTRKAIVRIAKPRFLLAFMLPFNSYVRTFGAKPRRIISVLESTFVHVERSRRCVTWCSGARFYSGTQQREDPSPAASIRPTLFSALVFPPVAYRALVQLNACATRKVRSVANRTQKQYRSDL